MKTRPTFRFTARYLSLAVKTEIHETVTPQRFAKPNCEGWRSFFSLAAPNPEFPTECREWRQWRDFPALTHGSLHRWKPEYDPSLG
jgi:hypothetical protein